MTKGFLIAIVFVVVIALALSFFFTKNQVPGSTGGTAEENEVTVVPQNDMGGERQFTIEVKENSYSPSNLSVNKDEVVVVTLKNSDTTIHNFTIDEFGVNSGVLKSGESRKFEFTAEKSGIFDFYCGIANHRTLGMVGKLEVK